MREGRLQEVPNIVIRLGNFWFLENWSLRRGSRLREVDVTGGLTVSLVNLDSSLSLLTGRGLRRLGYSSTIWRRLVLTSEKTKTFTCEMQPHHVVIFHDLFLLE